MSDASNPIAGHVDHCVVPHPDARKQPPEPLTTGYPQAAMEAGDWGTGSCIFAAIGGLNPARGSWRLRRSCHASEVRAEVRRGRCVGHVVAYVGCTASRVGDSLSTSRDSSRSSGGTSLLREVASPSVSDTPGGFACPHAYRGVPATPTASKGAQNA